jgi:hypothetical protein
VIIHLPTMGDERTLSSPVDLVRLQQLYPIVGVNRHNF